MLEKKDPEEINDHKISTNPAFKKNSLWSF